MATWSRFEDLPIWQEARILAKDIYRLTSTEPFSKDYRFCGQIRAAAGSIMDNIAEGFEKEMEYFDHSMIDHFRNSVGSGQANEAEYQDKIISRVKYKKVLGITVTRFALFITMLILWSVAFKNIALGICFAICFVGSFTMITNKSKSEEKEA